MSKQYLDKKGLETLWGKIKAYTVFVKGDADNSAVLKGGNNVASSINSSAFGLETKASGEASHAEGKYTKTTNEAEHAEGKYNVSNTNTIHSVGIGASDTDRKNAHEIMQDGRHYIYNLGGYDGTNPDDSYDIATYLPNMVNITYKALSDLKSNSKLVPGQQYRITDYVTTTTQNNTRTAEEYHQFDIIVVADDVNILNENARSIQHDGDTYFTDSDLNAWELKYCLDNDTNRFAWADATNGKGVIYYMKDEFNNECPYDFKNIQFRHNTYPDYYYTFTWIDENNDIMDTSVFGNNGTLTYYGAIYGVYGNVIKTYNTYDGSLGICQMLNNIVFISHVGHEMVGNDGFYGCYNNSFGYNCRDNFFRNSCYNNSFGNNCFENSFGIDCFENSFGDNCYRNSFGIGCYGNSFGYNCHDNSFGYNCQYNSFGNGCYYNSFGESSLNPKSYYRYIIFDNGNRNINLNCTSTTSSSKYFQNVRIGLGVNNTGTYKTISDSNVSQTYETYYKPANSQTITI